MIHGGGGKAVRPSRVARKSAGGWGPTRLRKDDKLAADYPKVNSSAYSPRTRAKRAYERRPFSGSRKWAANRQGGTASAAAQSSGVDLMRGSCESRAVEDRILKPTSPPETNWTKAIS